MPDKDVDVSAGGVIFHSILEMCFLFHWCRLAWMEIISFSCTKGQVNSDLTQSCNNLLLKGKWEKKRRVWFIYSVCCLQRKASAARQTHTLTVFAWVLIWVACREKWRFWQTAFGYTLHIGIPFITLQAKILCSSYPIQHVLWEDWNNGSWVS